MTRKHFKAMAETVSKIKDIVERRNAAMALADMCARSNPRFNLRKFLDACNAG